MKKKIYIYTILIISILSLLYYCHSKMKEYSYIEAVVNDLLVTTKFDEYADSVEASINDSLLIIKADLSELFDGLSLEEQFEILEYYTTQVQILCRFSNSTTPSLSNEIHFYGMTEENIYQLNTNPVTYPTALYYSILSINGKTVYNSTLFIEEVNQSVIDTEEYEYAKEVIEYSKYFMDLMTNHGRDFNPSKDVKLIQNAVKKKFGLEPDQFNELYRQYALKLN